MEAEAFLLIFICQTEKNSGFSNGQKIFKK